MSEQKKLDEKLYQYLLHLFDKTETEKPHEFLTYSDVYYSPDWSSSFKNAKKLLFVVNPEIYKKYDNNLKSLERAIGKKFYKFTKIYISDTDSIPDLKKFQILKNGIVPIFTEWEDINIRQKRILEQLRTAKEIIDFQNIGNSCRTLMQKISEIVFDEFKHIAPEKIDLSVGKFKNRLHTYIKTELGGSSNKELKDYALSAITTAEKSIDLANKLTHDMNADLIIAETCVISTISAISVIKLTATR